MMGLALDNSVGTGIKDATIRNIDDFVSPCLKGGQATIRTGAKIKEKHSVHKCKAPMIARKARHIEEREGSVLTSFHMRPRFAIAGRIVVTSVLHDTVLRSNCDTKFRAALEFTTIITAPSKGRDAIGLDNVFSKPDPKSNRRVLVVSEKDPGCIRSKSCNSNKEGLETRYGRYVEETEIHMKTSIIDIEYQICSRAIRNRLTFGA